MGTHTYVPDSCKELVKALRTVSYSRSIHEVFQDWLAVSAIAISNAVDWKQQKQREEIYTEIISKYSKAEQGKLAEALAQLVMAYRRNIISMDLLTFSVRSFMRLSCTASTKDSSSHHPMYVR